MDFCVQSAAVTSSQQHASKDHRDRSLLTGCCQSGWAVERRPPPEAAIRRHPGVRPLYLGTRKTMEIEPVTHAGPDPANRPAAASTGREQALSTPSSQSCGDESSPSRFTGPELANGRRGGGKADGQLHELTDKETFSRAPTAGVRRRDRPVAGMSLRMPEVGRALRGTATCPEGPMNSARLANVRTVALYQLTPMWRRRPPLNPAEAVACRSRPKPVRRSIHPSHLVAWPFGSAFAAALADAEYGLMPTCFRTRRARFGLLQRAQSRAMRRAKGSCCFGS